MLIGDASLWTDMVFVKAVARRHPDLLLWASGHQYGIPLLQTEKKRVLQIVKLSPEQLQWVDDAMKRDSEVVLAAVRRNGEVLRHAHEDMKKDRRIVAAAVRKNPQALRHAHSSLQMSGAGGKEEALRRLLSEVKKSA